MGMPTKMEEREFISPVTRETFKALVPVGSQPLPLQKVALVLRFIGIDPGKDGAVAWMDGEHRDIGVLTTPTYQVQNPSKPGKTKCVYDLVAMYRMLKEITDPSRFECIVTIEQVGSFRSDSHKTAFDFGGGHMAWLMACAVLNADRGNVKVRQVPPKTWKRDLLAGVANDPEMEAKVLAQRLRGHAVCREWRGPKGKLLDGKVDALFLAEHGRYNYQIGRPMTLGGVR
jgi:hypothetical protein